MFDRTYPKSLTCGLVAVLAMLAATPALADNAADLDARAAAAYNRGLDARNAGQNAAACQHFRSSEALYHNSITALMGRPMYTEELREEVKNLAAMQQSNLNGAKAKAQEVCGRPDGPALSSSSSGSVAVDADDSYAAKKDLQRIGDLAHSQYKESVHLWEAGNRAGACAMIRLSTANFDKAIAAIKANPALARGAFVNPDGVVANGQVAAEVRDEDFCKT